MPLFEVRVNKEITGGGRVFCALHLTGLGSSLARLITLTVPLFRQNHQWVFTNKILEGNLAIDLQPLTAVVMKLPGT